MKIDRLINEPYIDKGEFIAFYKKTSEFNFLRMIISGSEGSCPIFTKKQLENEDGEFYFNHIKDKLSFLEEEMVEHLFFHAENYVVEKNKYKYLNYDTFLNSSFSHRLSYIMSIPELKTYFLDRNINRLIKAYVSKNHENK